MTTKPFRKRRRKNPGYDSRYSSFDSEVGKIITEILGIVIEPKIVEMKIPEEMFRKLLMLCHPDRHGNSETATEVTRWLLEHRA